MKRRPRTLVDSSSGADHVFGVSNDPIPALRTDLEVSHRIDGQVDIRDPRLINVFTFEARSHEIAVYFDGRRSVEDVRDSLIEQEELEVDEDEVRRIAEEFEELFLLDTPEAKNAEPTIENKAPHSLLKGVSHPLQVLPQTQPEGRWSCQACGACCHGLAGEVTKEEEARIDPSLYQDVLGGRDFAVDAFIDPEDQAQRILRQRPEDRYACIFLSKEGLCLIHARQGMQSKPDACQIFPYVVVHIPRRKPRLAMRTNCHSMHASWKTGAQPEEAIPEVRRLLRGHSSLKIPTQMPVFGERRSSVQVRILLDEIGEVLAREGAGPKALRFIDTTYLEGRLKGSRRAYGRNLLAYLKEERNGKVPVQEGGLEEHLSLAGPPQPALEAMRRGKNAPEPRPEVGAFLARQTGLALFGFGPLNLPDAGVGLVALLLSLEACLHVLGPKGKMRDANRAFMVYTSPVLENTAHAWPIVDAVDAELGASLRHRYMRLYERYAL